MLAVDTETTGVTFHDEAFLVSFAGRYAPAMNVIGSGPGPKNVKVFRGPTVDVVPYGVWKHMPKGISLHSWAWDIDHPRVPAALAEKPWIFWNAKFDLQKLILAGLIDRDELTPDSFHDAQTIRYLLDEHSPLALKDNARRLLGIETDELERVKEAKKVVKKEQGIRYERDIGYHLLPREVVEPYAKKDAEMTLLLFELLYPQLPQELHRLYRMERELILTLLDMESAGLGVDTEYVDATEKEFRKKIFYSELNIKDTVGDDDFNPNSPKQVMEAFAVRGVEVTSTAKAKLKELDDPLAAQLLELRHNAKVHGTYLIPLQAETKDGIVHPHFNPAKTKTARLSSSGTAE